MSKIIKNPRVPTNVQKLTRNASQINSFISFFGTQKKKHLIQTLINNILDHSRSKPPLSHIAVQSEFLCRPATGSAAAKGIQSPMICNHALCKSCPHFGRKAGSRFKHAHMKSTASVERHLGNPGKCLPASVVGVIPVSNS